MQYRNWIFITLYLVAIVLANLTVAWFGPKMVIINAFLFIGLDLTSRDYLHEAWHKKGLVWKMLLLIGAGSLITLALNRDAAQIAFASFMAFSLAAIVDTVSYHFLREKAYIIKINGSNVTSALVDSIVFPTLAFGVFMPWIILGQFAAKVGGGFVWSLILKRMRS